MPNCPKCFFGLVLREHSRKYKCPGCGKVWPQKEIDTKEFVEWNKKERKNDWTEFHRVTKEEKRKKQIENNKRWYQNHKEEVLKTKKEKAKQKQAKYREANREKYNQEKREYWAKKKEQLNEKRRRNYQVNKDQIRDKQASYRLNNKVLRQINHQRTQQKVITLRMIENGTINLYRYEFKSILPTF